MAAKKDEEAKASTTPTVKTRRQLPSIPSVGDPEQTTEAIDPSKFCPFCGKDLDWKFCPFCGKPLPH